jgi:DNA-binding response OmpR family regulator
MLNSQELLQYTQGLTLLFAEDHDELRESTTEILKNFFSRVDAVKDGQEALIEYQKNDTYDIVLTDIRMPNMDGVALTEAIYAIEPKQHIIVISAHDESSYLIPLINLGVSQFIQKPIERQELIEALYKVAKKLHGKEENQEEISEIFVLNHQYHYNREKKLLLKDNKSIYLTKFEILFLDLLTSQNAKIFSNEEIVQHYTSNKEEIDPQNIRKLVSKLRKKIPQETIESIYGVGYRAISQA